SAEVPLPNGNAIATDPKLMESLIDYSDLSVSVLREIVGGNSLDAQYNGNLKFFEEGFEQNIRLFTDSADAWLEDRLFVHDELAAGKIAPATAKIITSGDFSHVGHMGWSYGGATAATVCYQDDRCVASINLDGSNYYLTPFNQEHPKPFMMMYADPERLAGDLGVSLNQTSVLFNDFSYESHANAGQRENIYRLFIKGATHRDMSDFRLIMNRPVRSLFRGSIDDGTMSNLLNDFVLGFFDRHLRHSTTDFPQAEFAKYQTRATPHNVSNVSAWWQSKTPEERAQLAQRLDRLRQ
ncbi:MAG: hypothetical protein AAF512_04545, partial [Pseudomonadota bacterium]